MHIRYLPGSGFFRHVFMAGRHKVLEMILFPRASDPQNGLHPCVMPNIPPYTCKQPADYVFWDGVHPTKTVHGIIADEVGMLMAD